MQTKPQARVQLEGLIGVQTEMEIETKVKREWRSDAPLGICRDS